MNIVIDIKQFVNTAIPEDVEPYLYISDDPEEIERLNSNGHIVVPVLTDSNRYQDFSAYKYVITSPEDVDDDYYLKIWQRHAHIPWEILRTDRCIVREMTADDVTALYEVYADESITDYTEPLFPDYEDELEYTHNYIERVYSYFGFGTWVIENIADGRIIGRVGFNYREGIADPELGYVIGKKDQKRGIAAEVCEAVIRYGFDQLDFDEISAFSALENIPSCKLLKTLGFVREECEKEVFLESKGRKIKLDFYIKKRG